MAINEDMGLGEISREILKSTCRFFITKKGTTEIPYPNGCGVFFKHNNKHYCFSNAHVLGDEKLKHTYILVGDRKKSTLGGQYFYSKLPSSGKRMDDSIDLAIICLSDDTVDLLQEKGYEFINSQHISTGYSIKKGDELMIIGYPGSKIKIDNTNKTISNHPVFLKTEPFLKDLISLNYPKKFHFIAKYSINRFYNLKTKKIERGSKPHGISGSGLWLLKKNMKNQYDFCLIGILSEYLENRGLVVSTKIDFFMDVLRQTADPTILNNGIQVDLSI